MKILIVVHDYLPLHKGGSEIHAHQTACELMARGHEVTALFTERDLSVPEGSVRRGNLDGVPTIELVHQREYADLRETWEQGAAGERFREIVAEVAPDVCHFHHLALWGSSALPTAKELGARVVVTLHDYYLLCDAATLLTSDARICTDGLRGECSDCLRRHPVLPERWGGGEREDIFRRGAAERFEQHRRHLACADHIVSPSHFLAGLFEQAGFLRADRCTILRAGYPGPVRPPRRRDRAAPLRVGYVGGIYFSKGVHLLVAAFGQLTDAACELHVHGHLDWFPDYADELRREAQGRAVHFHGPFDPPRIDEILGEIDVLVVPSVWYENMPITINEAFRNGIPVVTADFGGMAEAVQHGENGLLFPRGDVSGLARALRRLSEDADLYDRLARGRPQVLSVEAVCDRLEAIYGQSRGGA